MESITYPQVALPGVTYWFKYSQAAKRRLKDHGVLPLLTKTAEERTVDENETLLIACIGAMAYVMNGEQPVHAGLSIEAVEELITAKTIPIFSEAITAAFLAVLPDATPAAEQPVVN